MKKVVLFLIVFYSMPIMAQEQNHEVNSEVKELKSFHTVIYKLWHTAWPSKDVKLLQSLLPDIEKGTQGIITAKLPGILREKKIKWDNGVAALTKCVEDYKVAVAKKDSVELLDVAEKLHAKYEGLVRIIRPVVKEVDQFHQELYLVYHYYLPDSNIEKILSSAKIMESKISDMKKASLPVKLSSKKAAYDNSVSELETAVIKLNKLTATPSDIKAINEAVVLVHTKYQNIEKLFD